MRSLRGSVLAALVLGLGLLLSALSAGASAAVSIRPPAGSPDPKQMVLTTSDLGRGARATSQRYYKDADFPSVISYEREFESGRVGSTELPYVISEAEIGTSAQSTASYLTTIRRALGTKQVRELVKEGFAEESSTGGLISNVQIGRPRNLGVGPGSFDLLITVKLLGLRTELHIAAFRVDRVLGALVTVGAPGGRVRRTVMTRLAKIMAGRMRVELAPKNTVRPAISGTPEAGGYTRRMVRPERGGMQSSRCCVRPAGVSPGAVGTPVRRVAGSGRVERSARPERSVKSPQGAEWFLRGRQSCGPNARA